MTQLKIIPTLSALLVDIVKARREFPPPSRPIAYHASTFQLTRESSLSDAKTQVDDTQSLIQSAMQRPDPKTTAQLSKLNSKLRAQGKSPLDWATSVRQIEDIRTGSGSEKEKKSRIEQLRKQMGLSKGEMKKIFTQALAAIHQKAANRLQAIQKQKQAQFGQELRTAEQVFGKNSPQVQAMQETHHAVMRQFESAKQTHQQQAGFYKKLYPSFWSKLGGVFKKIGGGILRAVQSVGSILKKIPVIGSFARIAENILTPLKKLFTGNIGGYFKSMGIGLLKSIGDAKGLLPLIPGVGPIASMLASGVGGLVSKFRAQS